MKHLLLLMLATLIMCSCEYKPLDTTEIVNGIHVEFLFEKDSVKVYRFHDGGYTHYFTTRGETMSEKHTDKNTIRDENIQ